MFGRNVFQIGMYLSVELWVEAIFFIYIGCYIIMFICLFFCFVIDFFVGTTHSFLHIFYSCVLHFPVEGEQFMQQYTKSRLQPSDVKLQSLSQTLQCQK